MITPILSFSGLLMLILLIRRYLKNSRSFRSAVHDFGSLTEQIDEDKSLDFIRTYLKRSENSHGKITELFLFYTSDDLAYHTALIMKNSVYHTSRIGGHIKVITNEIKTLSAGIDESSATINQITRTVSNSVRQIEQQSSAIEEMPASIANISRITTSKKERSEELVTLTANGEQQMSSMNENTRNISDNTSSMNDVIGMNAAIEATHAGDAGRGFSVVADDIRKPAESISVNSTLIASNLKNVIDGIHSVDSASSENLTFLKEIKLESSNMVTALSEIINATAELDAESKESLAVINSFEMESGTDQIDMAIQNIQDAVSNSKNHVVNIFATTGEINDILHKLTDSNINSGRILEKVKNLSAMICPGIR